MSNKPTEMWVRNPEYYIRECLEVGIGNIVWDYGYLRKKNLDPSQFAALYFPPTVQWRMLAVGSADQGAREIVPGFSLTDPKATYPVWEYGMPFNALQDILEERPTGREHRVVITQLPCVQYSLGHSFIRQLNELQEEYMDCIMHIHGLYSWRWSFGQSFQAADVDGRTHARKGIVILPNGRKMNFERAEEFPQWVNLLNMSVKDLNVPRNRCMFNLRSALWASKYFKEQVRFAYRGLRHEVINPDAIEPEPPANQTIFMRRKRFVEAGDKFLCDTCSLQLDCKLYREGAICVVPDSEPTELARYFKSRDSDVIIEGLGTLLATQTRRLKSGLDAENFEGELDPEVTKIIKSLFDSGVKLAKLVNPALAAAAAPKVGLTFNQQNNTAITAANPQALMAAIVAELEGRGIPRAQITPEMVQELMMVPEEKRQQSIEAVAIEASGG